MCKCGFRAAENTRHLGALNVYRLVGAPSISHGDSAEAAAVSLASGKSLSLVAELHDSATAEVTVKTSSSRWADRPVPVLQVEFPEPWSIIAAARPAVATGAKCAGNMKWSGRRDLNPGPFDPQSNALPGCATPRRLWKKKGNPSTRTSNGQAPAATLRASPPFPPLASRHRISRVASKSLADAR